MFLSQNQFINMKLTVEGGMNESGIIKYIINEDLLSPAKEKMAEGERYYAYEQDILQKSFNRATVSETAETPGGTEERLRVFENPNRSNHHNVNAFHRMLVDQKVAYIMGRRPTISVKGAETDAELSKYQEFLSGFAGEEFADTIQDLIVGASNKGCEALHVYYDEEGNFRYTIVPAEELILIYDTLHERELAEVIRYYGITVVRNGEKTLRRRVEWWTKKDVTYYVENDDHEFVPDSGMTYNPSPHWWGITSLNGMEKKRTPQSWGRLPFIVLKNNHRGTTDLEGIKGLIDAYDMISSEGANNLLDLVELYWVIEGYGGEAASAINRKLRINKAVHISDSSGKVEARQVEIPVEGRLSYMKMLRRDIFSFGQGVDVDAEKFGNAPSGVALRFQYTLLDLKAGNIIGKVKRAMRELFWFATKDINRRNGTDFDSGLAEITINKTMITNDSETAEIINASRGLLSSRTLIAKHPFVEDVDSELKDIAAEKAEAADEQEPPGGPEPPDEHGQ